MQKELYGRKLKKQTKKRVKTRNLISRNQKTPTHSFILKGHIYLYGIILAFVSIVTCTGKNTPTSPENNPPNKPSLTATSINVFSGESVSISSSSSDPDGDEITYFWSATGGSFNYTDKPTVIWTAPSVTVYATYTITSRVYDSHGLSNSSSINIAVSPKENNPAPETIYITCNKDVFVSSGFPDRNCDIANEDFMGTFLALTPEGSTTSFGETRIYVYFDLSSIPSSSTIDEAVIIMRPKPDGGVTNSNTVCGALLLSKVNFGTSSTYWDESSLTWNSSLNYLVSNAQNSGWLFNIANANSNLQADVKLDIQAYANGNVDIITNYNGWVIQSFSNLASDCKLFWSSDCSSSSYFPKLKVTYY